MARYARVKGEAEEAVRQSGPAIVSIFRPGMIIGSKHTPWLLEKVLPLFSAVTPLKGGFNRTSQHLTNEVDDDKDRQAKIESFDTKQTVLTGSAPSFGQGGATAILGGD